MKNGEEVKPSQWLRIEELGFSRWQDEAGIERDPKALINE